MRYAKKGGNEFINICTETPRLQIPSGKNITKDWLQELQCDWGNLLNSNYVIKIYERYCGSMDRWG